MDCHNNHMNSMNCKVSVHTCELMAFFSTAMGSLTAPIDEPLRVKVMQKCSAVLLNDSEATIAGKCNTNVSCKATSSCLYRNATQQKSSHTVCAKLTFILTR